MGKNPIEIVHEYYVSQGGHLKNILEFETYITIWLSIIGQRFETIYNFVLSKLK